MLKKFGKRCVSIIKSKNKLVIFKICFILLAIEIVRVYLLMPLLIFFVVEPADYQGLKYYENESYLEFEKGQIFIDSFFKYNREKFLIQSISYNLGTDSQMTVTCSGLTNFTPDPYGDLEYVPCTSEAQAVALILNWFGGSLPSGQSLTKDNEDDNYYYYGLYSDGTMINYFTVSKENSLITTET